MPSRVNGKSVAIIGAGPAGLIALDAVLRENSFDVVRVFDKSPEAGGIWAFDSLPPKPFGKEHGTRDHTDAHENKQFSDGPMYESLITNVAAKVMEFTQEPFPTDLPQIEGTDPARLSHFRSNLSVKNWLHSFYKDKGYEEHLTLNTSVDSVNKNTRSDKWDLALRIHRPGGSVSWTESFDFVVVASGMYTQPYVPQIPGLYEFNDSVHGNVIHTRGYRSPRPYQHKKVIVVGSSISAIEVIHSILGLAQLPVISSQRINNPDRHSYLGNGPFHSPGIKVCAEIVSIDPESRTVHFSDGHSEQCVDAIILATGYTPKLDYVPSLKVDGHRVCDLYQHVIPIDDPSIALIGFICGGFTFKVYEWQAVLAARVFSGRAALPSPSEQAGWVQNRIETIGTSGQFHNISSDFEDYFNTLRLLATNCGPGRKLPIFDRKWIEMFNEGAQQKLAYFCSKSDELAREKGC